MRTLAKSSIQALHIAVLLIAVCAAGTAPANARQLNDGMTGLKAYRIEFNERNHRNSRRRGTRQFESTTRLHRGSRVLDLDTRSCMARNVHARSRRYRAGLLFIQLGDVSPRPL